MIWEMVYYSGIFRFKKWPRRKFLGLKMPHASFQILIGSLWQIMGLSRIGVVFVSQITF